MWRGLEDELEALDEVGGEAHLGTQSSHDVIDNRIDVGAQRAILRMRANPVTAADANAMLAAVKTGHLAGIYGDDLRASAQLAARLSVVRWELVPPGRVATLVREPNPLAPPTLVFRAHMRSDLANLAQSLLEAWGLRLAWAGDPVLVENPHTGRYDWRPRSHLAHWATAAAPSPARRLQDPTPLRTVGNTTAVPYRFICWLEMNFGNVTAGRIFRPTPGRGWGTGLLISPRHVLTAAHCLLTGVAGVDRLGLGLGIPTWAQTVTITPGRHGDQRPFPSAVVTRTQTQPFRVHPKWQDSGDINYDFGLITLAAPLADGPGHWSGPNTRTLIRPPVNILPPEPRLYIAGYPGDRYPPVHTLNRIKGMPRMYTAADLGTSQWESEGEPLSATKERVIYNLDESAGMSGSPVWVRDKSGLNLVAIHTRGEPQTITTGTVVSGVRITREVVNTLRGWMALDKVRPTFS